MMQVSENHRNRLKEEEGGNDLSHTLVKNTVIRVCVYNSCANMQTPLLIRFLVCVLADGFTWSTLCKPWAQLCFTGPSFSQIGREQWSGKVRMDMEIFSPILHYY